MGDFYYDIEFESGAGDRSRTGVTGLGSQGITVLLHPHKCVTHENNLTINIFQAAIAKTPPFLTQSFRVSTGLTVKK